MDLIIVESPTKAKTLSRFLGGDFRVEASMGHVRDLPESKLGIDTEHDFAPEYIVSKGKEGVVRELRGLAGKATKIILATDPDREGEAIAFHISELIKEEIKDKGSKTKDKKKENGEEKRIQRITFHEITEAAIKEALLRPGTINMPLVDAQQARRILDRLVGYKLSPLLWRKVRKGLSAGRVQSVAVRLIVEREREIQAFKAEEYWEVVARLRRVEDQIKDKSSEIKDRKTEDGEQKEKEFQAKLGKIDGKPAEIKNKEQADKIVAELSSAEYKVADIQTKEVKKYPYPPYMTSTLQQVAANIFGWSAKQTMRIAQGLYEQGLITYHRTDSMNLATVAVGNVRRFIAEQYGEKYLPAEPRFYRTKSKVAQEAHEAIRPTDIQQLAVSSKQLERDQHKLYELIWKRFVACQMAEARYEQTGVDVTAQIKDKGDEIRDGKVENGEKEGEGRYLFRASGSRQLFDGWTKLYEIKDKGDEIKDRKKENGDENKELPKLNKFDKLDLLDLLPSQHFTQAPARFTEASLIKTLEEYGIGRPSTYAPIISTIQERQYVEKIDSSPGQGKKLIPTSLGFAVTDFLMSNFAGPGLIGANIMDYQFTALMEDNLDAVANGEKEWVPVIRDFYEPFDRQLTEVQEKAERVKIEAEKTGENCPQCQAPLVVRIGRFGKFIACSKFPQCKYTAKIIQKLPNAQCPKCGGDVVIKKTKTRRSFYGCGNYPTCDWASWTKPK